MKKILCIFTFIVIFFGLNKVGVASLGGNRGSDTSGEYLSIFVEYLTAPKPLGMQDYFAAVKSLTIDRYKKFIQDHPNSSFVPEAKLRIAEFYDVICQRERAKIWLDDIIANHGDDDYYGIKAYYKPDGNYSRFVLIFSGEKTAAWALYYRASWFPENRERDLKRIINEYKESKQIVEFAKEIFNKK